MIPLTSASLIAAASSLIGLREEGGNNRGLMIDLFLRGVGQMRGQPWCAAFVHHVGYWSHFDHERGASVWPLPATASCYVLGDFARRKRILKDEPEPGDVFLLWNPRLGRFSHTGIVAHVHEDADDQGDTGWITCDTIEGNTNDDGSREGDAVLRRVRRFWPKLGDRFIRWTDLDNWPIAGTPAGRSGQAA